MMVADYYIDFLFPLTTSMEFSRLPRAARRVALEDLARCSAWPSYDLISVNNITNKSTPEYKHSSMTNGIEFGIARGKLPILKTREEEGEGEE